MVIVTHNIEHPSGYMRSFNDKNTNKYQVPKSHQSNYTCSTRRWLHPLAVRVNALRSHHGHCGRAQMKAAVFVRWDREHRVGRRGGGGGLRGRDWMCPSPGGGGGHLQHHALPLYSSHVLEGE